MDAKNENRTPQCRMSIEGGKTRKTEPEKTGETAAAKPTIAEEALQRMPVSVHGCNPTRLQPEELTQS